MPMPFLESCIMSTTESVVLKARKLLGNAVAELS